MTKDMDRDIQDRFLDYLREHETPVTIFLVNGVRLQGAVTGFDKLCILLSRDGHSQLVYKNAVSTVLPSVPIPLNDERGDTGSGVG